MVRHVPHVSVPPAVLWFWPCGFTFLLHVTQAINMQCHAKHISFWKNLKRSSKWMKWFKMPFEFTPLRTICWRQVCNQPGALRCHPLPEIHKSMPQDQKRHKTNTAEPTIEHIFEMCSYLHSLCFCSIVSWPTPADHIRAVSPCHMYIHVRSAGMFVKLFWQVVKHRQHVSNMSYRQSGRRSKAHSYMRLCFANSLLSMALWKNLLAFPEWKYLQSHEHRLSNMSKQTQESSKGSPARNCEFTFRKSQGSLVSKCEKNTRFPALRWIRGLTVPLEFDFAQHFLPPQLWVIAACQIAKAC